MSKHIVICDIDGTVSRVGDRIKYLKSNPPDWDAFYAASFEDEPIRDICYLVDYLALSYRIIFCTGRRESVRGITLDWLKTYVCGFPDEDLFMRPNGDIRHDTEVKPELIAHIPKDDIAFIIEDRNSMVKKWRELGYTVLQPADGDF